VAAAALRAHRLVRPPADTADLPHPPGRRTPSRAQGIQAAKPKKQSLEAGYVLANMNMAPPRATQLSLARGSAWQQSGGLGGSEPAGSAKTDQ